MPRVSSTSFSSNKLMKRQLLRDWQEMLKSRERKPTSARREENLSLKKMTEAKVVCLEEPLEFKMLERTMIKLIDHLESVELQQKILDSLVDHR